MAKRNLYLRLRVTPHQVDYRSINWYRDAHNIIVREYGDGADLFCGFLAATNPRKQVKANFKLADKLYKAHKNRQIDPKTFGDVLGSLMPAHLINVLRVLQGQELSGNKVKAFFKNLVGDLNVVTIDMWIALAYGIDQKSLTEKQYDRLAERMSKEADAIGLKPAEYQALIWSAIRRESGKAYKSFVAAWQDLCQPTFWDLL